MLLTRNNSIAIAMITCSLLSGCAQYSARSAASLPLNSIIEPAKDSRQVEQKSTLTFPASVAILFIPSSNVPETTLRESADSLKQQLLLNTKYVRSVSIVATEDIRSKISLAQIRAMYDAEIAMILSFKQDQHYQQSGPGGLMDLTIVGAMTIPSVGTTTSTNIDGKLIHIASNALVFRQSGTDKRTTYSTSYGVDSTLAEQSSLSILAATTNFGKALENTLSKFDRFDAAQAISLDILTANDQGASKDSAPTDTNWNKVDRFKFSGGGSLDILSLALVLPYACCMYRRRFESIRTSHQN